MSEENQQQYVGTVTNYDTSGVEDSGKIDSDAFQNPMHFFSGIADSIPAGLEEGDEVVFTVPTDGQGKPVRNIWKLDDEQVWEVLIDGTVEMVVNSHEDAQEAAEYFEKSEQGEEITFRFNPDESYTEYDFTGDDLEEMVSDEDEDEDEEADAPSSDEGFIYNFDMKTEVEDDRVPLSEQESPAKLERWTLGSHSTATQSTRDAIEEALKTVDGDINKSLRDTLQSAADMVQNSVSQFTCKVCGLGHDHPDHKHDIRDQYVDTPGFSVNDAFAGFMKYNPYCHCGVNELGMLIDFYPLFDVKVFDDEHKFDGVKSLSYDDFQSLVRHMSEPLGDYESSALNAYEASSRANLQHLSDEVLDDLNTFYPRYRDIKRQSGGAPIGQDVRSDIDDLRESMEARVQ